MNGAPRHLLARLARAAMGCLLGGAMAVPLGPTSTSRAVNQMNSTSMRPLPSVAPRATPQEPMVWVPDRHVPLPGAGTVVVPGHWERRLEQQRDVHVPALTVRNPVTGETTTLPAGQRPPVEDRLAP